MINYTLDDIAKKIDFASFNLTTTYDDLKKLCEKAKKSHFHELMVCSGQVRYCYDQLATSEVVVGSAVSFPLGQMSIASKAFEVEDAISNGAKEIAYVPNLTEFKSGNDEYLKNEMTVVTEVCETRDVLSTVIFDFNYLTREEIIRAVSLVQEIKPNLFQTATDFTTAPIQLADLKFLKKFLGDQIKIKVAGKLNSYDDFLQLAAAGANQFLTDQGDHILQEAEKSTA